MAAPAYSDPTAQRSSVNGGSMLRRKTEQVVPTSTAPAPTEPASNGHVRLKDVKPARTRKKPRSLLRRLKRRAIKHTWSIPLLLLVAFASLYALDPTESNIIHHFIFLSYRQDPVPGASGPSAPAQYGKGLWDIAFVSFYTIVLTFTREFIMQELLHPLARASGIKSRGKQLRFMEQMYTAIYFGISGPVGLYVMRETPVWYFNTRGMYELFPHRTHEAAFKFYYLFEAAYWAQQALVMILGMEKPRKDFRELVAHHIVTLALIGLSYRFHFTYIGIAVYITHDISDFFLAVSKSFHYIDSELVIPFYALNVGTWIYLRHYLNLRILWSLLTEFRTVGPYELNWETQQYKCWISNIITFALLAMLQSLNLFWLYCLLRSAWKFISTGEKKDDRSEDESEGEEVVGGQNGAVKGH
ncbi:TLC domain-containing protein [Aspergillus lucknowensis]|uniref:TLC domain-containing protein n=1 Tax=Aspergillus lucknowensis TaxID=176173 RepID=A0ABR4LF30_9EURO